jgi:hypothetical protein
VFELPAVVDMLPAVSDKYKGKISWVKVGTTSPCLGNICGVYFQDVPWCGTCCSSDCSTRPVTAQVWLASLSVTDTP